LRIIGLILENINVFFGAPGKFFPLKFRFIKAKQADKDEKNFASRITGLVLTKFYLY
jgi:hypothetical protein